MREKDAVSNVFLSDPARVADLLNGYVYCGQQVIKKEDVQNRGERVYRIKDKERKMYLDSCRGMETKRNYPLMWRKMKGYFPD